MSTDVIGTRVAVLSEKFQSSIGLPFRDVLSGADIESALVEEGAIYRDRLFSPLGHDMGHAVPGFR